MSKSKHAIILFNAGLGDGLQAVPFWKELKKQNWKLTGLFGTSYFSTEIIQPLNIFEEVISASDHSKLWSFVFSNVSKYEYSFIDFHSSSLEWSLAGCLLSKQSCTNRNKWYLNLLPNLKIRPMIPEAHNIHQHLNLAFDCTKDFPLEKLYNLRFPIKCFPNAITTSKQEYIVVQISAANNEVEYKNWALENWAWLFDMISIKFPLLTIILVGDKNETDKGVYVQQLIENPVESLIGKTSLSELAGLVRGAKMYLGLDSGTMHLAAMMKVPTFTLWGPTDPKTLGYEIINDDLHCDVIQKLSCHPCLSFINPNPTEVAHPLKCGHQRCIKQLGKMEVWEKFLHHWNNCYPSKEIS